MIGFEQIQEINHLTGVLVKQTDKAILVYTKVEPTRVKFSKSFLYKYLKVELVPAITWIPKQCCIFTPTGIIGNGRGKIQVEVDYWFESEWFRRLDYKLADLENNLIDFETMNKDRVDLIKKDYFGIIEPIKDDIKTQSQLIPLSTSVKILSTDTKEKNCFMCRIAKPVTDLINDTCSWCRKQLAEYNEL